MFITDDGDRMLLIESWSRKDLIIFCTQRKKISETLTLIDSRVSNHCFAERSLFVLYNTLDNPPIGLSAGKESTFEIIDRGRVEFLTSINNTQRKITFDNVLYIPGLRLNLISVLKLDSKGLYVTFRGERAQIKISHLRPFRTTVYAHIPLDLSLSKLMPRLVKVSLLGYFGQEGYKLLEQCSDQETSFLKKMLLI